MKKQSNTAANQQALAITNDSGSIFDTIQNTVMIDGLPVTKNQIGVMMSAAGKIPRLSLVTHEIEKEIGKLNKELKDSPIYQRLTELKTKRRALDKALTGLSEELTGVLMCILADYLPNSDLQTKLDTINSNRQLSAGAER